MPNSTVIILLSMAVFTGLFTMHKHFAYFYDFHFTDLLKGRKDSWLYVINNLSTAWCSIAIVVHLFKDCIGVEHELLWIWIVGFKWHGWHALAATFAHLMTNIVLAHDRRAQLKAKREF